MHPNLAARHTTMCLDCCGTEMEKDSNDEDAFKSDHPNKRMKLSLPKDRLKKRKVLSPTSRFNTTVSTNEIASSSKGFILTNIPKCTG